MTVIKHADPASIREAATLIQRGELVAFPTETVYGLGADALNAEAVARIYAAKGRPSTDPLIVHIHDARQIDQVAIRVPPLAYALMERFWPGALTLVLPRAESIPASVSAGLATVAVRMPDHPVAMQLIQMADRPIAAPSANRFAHTSPTTAQHVYDDLAGRLPLILDGGPCAIGVESTILNLTVQPPLVLRPGGISLEQLRDVIPTVARLERYLHPNEEALPAPGMLLKHYSPRATVRVYEGEPDAIRAAIRRDCADSIANGQCVGLMLADEDEVTDHRDVIIVRLGGLDDLEAVAQELFSGLRALDECGVDVILARAFPVTGIGAAVRDRMVRAAEGRIIAV